MEELLKRLLDGQERTEKQFIIFQNELRDIKESVLNIKESVHRIEEHLEETIMDTLKFIQKQNEVKDSQIKVLNNRLFEVESKVEQSQQ